MKFLRSRTARSVGFICVVGSVFLAGCKKPTTAAKYYSVRGKVMGKSIATQEITLSHGDVPGFMSAMTMDYSLPNTAVLEELQPGDQIAAQIVVDPLDQSHYWLQDVVITAEVARKEPPTRNPPHELAVGEPVPDIPLIDQNAHTFHLRDYAGKAVLLTFIYTRCPMPTFCRLVSSNFSHIHDALKHDPTLYQHAQLVSITLDPQYDTPPIMRKYSLAYVDGQENDLKTWTFASISPNDLKTLASAFGLEYFADGNQITHSMSTVLLSKDGRVVQVWKGSDWKWQDLLNATKEAAQK